MLNIPRITKNLLILNVLAFVAMLVVKGAGGGVDLNDLFGLHFFMAEDFHVWQLVTYMFMHANVEHIFFNMFALWMFGTSVERIWGERRFLLYYLACGIGAGLMQELVQFVWLEWASGGISHINPVYLNALTTVGASGAVYGILLAFGMTFPEQHIFIFPLPVPIKAKWFVCIYAAIELFSALATPGDQVAHFAHLGGMLFGYLLIRHWRKHASRYYDRRGGNDLFESMKRQWEKRNAAKVQQEQQSPKTRQNSEQDEIDAILDKIRKSGYDSLTREEKQRLFDRQKRQ